jgi:predicted dehydrogenase
MKAAILGAGRMGRRHVQVIRQAGLELVGICDTNPESLALTVTEQGVSQACLFNNADELLDKTSPECVIIATTAPSHCEYTCMAAKAGVKYILVEKPLAVSLDECNQMIDTCQRYGAKLAVNHQMRFMEQYSKPKALLNSAAYGGFKSMTVVGGNFGVAMNGTHYFEAFRYMADDEPIEVTAWFSPEVVPNPRGVQFEDRAGSIRVVTTSGKRLYLEIGADQGHGLQVTYAGRNGMIGINELAGEMVTSVREAQFRELPTTRYGMPAHVVREAITPAEVIDSTAQVLRALLTDYQNSVTAQRGMLAVKVLVAAYTSAENGSIPVRLDTELDHRRVFPWA